MNPQYLETFRRHRALFVLPLVLGAILAQWSAVGEPRLYRSTASLWSDTAGGFSAGAMGATPPAAQDQSMLNELLATRYFTHNIARGSPLQSYLEQHPSEGWGPTALIGKLRGTGTVDDRIALALRSERVTSSVHGPHVLELNFYATSPTLAVATLREIVEQFRKQRAILRRDALGAAQAQVGSASSALAKARTTLGDYLREHPGSTSADPEMRSLIAAERDAVTQVGIASETMNQVSTAILNGSAYETTLRIIDPPRLPIGPTTGKRHLVKVTLAGAFAGALVSMLGIVLLTKSGRRARPDERDHTNPPAAGTNGDHAVRDDDVWVPADVSAEAVARSEESRRE